MKRRLFFAFICLFIPIFLSVGCASSPDKKDGALSERGERLPPAFEHIPAHSPYVMATIKPFPMEVMEQFLPAYSEMVAGQLDAMQSYGAQMGGQDKATLLITALLEEFKDVSSIEDYERLGFAKRPHMAVYGIGWFPAMRMTISDADAMKGLLDRVDQKVGVVPQMRTVGEATFRQYDVESVKVAVAVHQGELIIGGAPVEVFDDFVGYLFGEKSIGRSMAETTTLQDLQATHGFAPYSVGYVDIEGTVQAISGATAPDPVTAEMLKKWDYQPPAELDDICRNEIVGLAQNAPRLAFGYTEMTVDRMVAKSVLETDSDFVRDLAEILAPIPGITENTVDNALFALGIGVDLKKAMDFVNKQANRIKSEPFECAALADINDWATSVPNTLAMVPPVVTSLRGALVSVTGLDVDESTVDGIALLKSDDPTGVLVQLRMLLPQLEDIELKPDGVPVALAPMEDLPELVEPHLAMNAHTLGFSVGAGMQRELQGVMGQGEAASTQGDPLLLFAYDYAEFMRALGMGEEDSLMGDDPMLPLVEMLKSFVMTVSPGEQGIEMIYSVSVEPPSRAPAARP